MYEHTKDITMDSIWKARMGDNMSKSHDGIYMFTR